MRKALILGLIFLAAGAGLATAQQRGGGQGGGQGGQGSPNHIQARPVPQPLPRCPDLAPGAYAYVTEIPGGAPLGADEIGLRWELRNSGNAPYAAPPTMQTLALEYSSPAGVQEVATASVPTDGPATLGQGQSWQGYMRVHVTPEVRRRTLRLHLRYNIDQYATPNDCDLTNNEVVITNPPAG